MNLRIVIVDYNMGNVASVVKALKKLGADSVVSYEKEIVGKADALILPGVGAFEDGMEYLKKRRLIPLLEQHVFERRRPLLGICLGMQMLAKESEEHGRHTGLGWIDARVTRLPESTAYRVPHVGWNDVAVLEDSVLFQDIQNPCFYFVHSYALELHDMSIATSLCHHGRSFPASIRKDKIFATQFHPEKSQNDGLALLDNFLKYVYAQD